MYLENKPVSKHETLLISQPLFILKTCSNNNFVARVVRIFTNDFSKTKKINVI